MILIQIYTLIFINIAFVFYSYVHVNTCYRKYQVKFLCTVLCIQNSVGEVSNSVTIYPEAMS